MIYTVSEIRNWLITLSFKMGKNLLYNLFAVLKQKFCSGWIKFDYVEDWGAIRSSTNLSSSILSNSWIALGRVWKGSISSIIWGFAAYLQLAEIFSICDFFSRIN